jgi:hypothetical protein
MNDDSCTCTVEVSPEEVDAGSDVTMTVRVAGLRKGLSKLAVSVRDQQHAELARAELKPADDDAHESDDIVLPVPGTVGEQLYRAVVLAAGKNGELQEQTSSEVRFTIKPHAALLNVWDVPSTVVAGERFKLTIGVKCSAGCDLGGQAVIIVDHEGSHVGAAHLGHEVWPGTEALYFAEMAAVAPSVPGNQRWEIKASPSASELPHDSGSCDIAVKVVSPPDCEVTVEAFDREKQTPIKGARVIIHPYRAMTDEHGVAKIKVTKGRYDILVSASKYVAASASVEVTADVLTRAELDKEPPSEPEDEVPGY